MSFWTQERMDYAAAAYQRGDSFTLIAQILGCTRNTVAGKVSRLKLPRRTTTARGCNVVKPNRVEKPRPAATPTQLVTWARELPPTEAQVRISVPRLIVSNTPKPSLPIVVDYRAKYKVNRGVFTCQWEDCGAAVARGSYCREHGARVYAGVRRA